MMVALNVSNELAFRVSTPLLSMHVVTKSTLASIIFLTSELMSVTPNDRALVEYATCATGYLSKLALTPSTHAAELDTLYASTPRRFLLSFFAT